MSENQIVGHCGRIFKEFQTCDEPKLDDLCQGCCMNDDVDEATEEELEDED